MTFAIVGGGATGIELASTLAEMRKFVLPQDYPDLNIAGPQLDKELAACRNRPAAAAVYISKQRLHGGHWPQSCRSRA